MDRSSKGAEALQSQSSRRLWKFSVGSLALAGVLAAIAVFLGGESWKAASTAGLVFLLNLLILAAFAGTHRWQRIALWILSPLTIALSIALVWIEGDYGDGYYDSSGDWIAVRTGYEIFSSWVWGLWWILAALVLLAFLSRCWKFLESSRALRLIYGTTVVLGLAVAVLAFLDSGLYDYSDSILKLIESVLAILALTGAAIVTITAFVERGRGQRSGENSEPRSSTVEALVDQRLRELIGSAASFEELKLRLEESSKDKSSSRFHRSGYESPAVVEE